MSILSPVDHAFFREHGYLVVPGVAPQRNLQPAINVICTFVEARLDDPTSWYRRTLGANGIVPIHHSQAFWDNRQHLRVHQVFSEIFGAPALWVSMDRGSFKPPVTAEHSDYHDESAIHWDRDPRHFSPYPVQGMLYLTDAAENQGAFKCVPEVYRSLESWLVAHPDDASIAEPDVSNYPIVRVPAPAGSLLIWSFLLPHGTGRNWADKPRITQAILMWPAGDETTRQERIMLWQQKRVPEVWRGWPGQIEPEPGEPAVLTDLGRKLLGLDLW